MNKNKIFKLIETIVESKSIVSSQISDSNIGNLVPIEEVYQGYMCGRAIQFTPHEDYGKKGELVRADLTDDKIRIQELTKLNNQITKYNKWVEEKNVLHEEEVRSLNLKPDVVHNLGEYDLKHKQYWELGQFEMWSFMVTRELPQQTTTFNNIKNTFLFINDEELYKANRDDPDFLIRINKTIAEYIHGEIREVLDKNRSIENSIWNEPNNRFGNWISQHPSDAESYEFNTDITITDVTDDLQYIAEDCSDMHENDKIKFPHKRDAYKWWCEHHTQNGKEITYEQLEEAYSRGKRRGKYDTEHNKPLLDKS